MNNQKFRAPAVPLITNDPMLNLWSFADRLNDDTTRHWTGVRQFMSGVVIVDGVAYEFLGTLSPDNRRYFAGYEKLPQVDCEIRPMTTRYRFENETIALELIFTSPLLLNDLELLSRPVSYMTYRFTAVDGKPHQVKLYYGFSGEFCVSDLTDSVELGMRGSTIYFSSGTERMLKRWGDDHRIEWGSFHINAPGSNLSAMSLRHFQRKIKRECLNLMQPVNYCDYQGPNNENNGPAVIELFEPVQVGACYPTIVTEELFTLDGAPYENHITLAYDDVRSIQYFGENIDAYWKKNGCDFDCMLVRAIAEYDEVLRKVKAFEDALLEKANAVSPHYAQLLSLAYRQTVSGHKLTWHGGELQFFSKENYSNGCIATVDVTYPSIPLFLLYAPELVEGMLNPIFKLVDKGLWEYPFAPHDVGRYPLANGQIYGFDFRYRRRVPDPKNSQMPVEECGNMLLCVAALCRAEKRYDYFEKHRALLTQWADYLVSVGFDPSNQLCTDDFAGHLAHNCNLSVKAICALGAFADCLRAVGEPERAKPYRTAAEDFSASWQREALDGEHYRLAFDRPETWSIKYNMVWDKLLDLRLFPQEVYDRELVWYKSHMNPYGLPLDSRADYTKSDWQLWSVAMFDDEEYRDAVIDAMYRFADETPERVPFTDLYFTSRPMQRGFQARTVQGGLFIELLKREKCL